MLVKVPPNFMLKWTWLSILRLWHPLNTQLQRIQRVAGSSYYIHFHNHDPFIAHSACDWRASKISMHSHACWVEHATKSSISLPAPSWRGQNCLVSPNGEAWRNEMHSHCDCTYIRQSLTSVGDWCKYWCFRLLVFLEIKARSGLHLVSLRMAISQCRHLGRDLHLNFG